MRTFMVRSVLSAPHLLSLCIPCPQAYAVDKWWFSFYRGIYSLVQTLVLLHFRLLPWLWNSLPRWIPFLANWGEIPHTITFVLLLGLAATVTNFPWSFYSTFVIEEKHGFNHQTFGVFFTDTVKRLILGAVLMPPAVAGFTYILQHAGPWVPLYLWAFVLGTSLIMITIYPVLIAPLFNKFENLPEGSLRSKVEALAGSLKFPLKVSSSRGAPSSSYQHLRATT